MGRRCVLVDVDERFLGDAVKRHFDVDRQSAIGDVAFELDAHLHPAGQAANERGQGQDQSSFLEQGRVEQIAQRPHVLLRPREDRPDFAKHFLRDGVIRQDAAGA